MCSLHVIESPCGGLGHVDLHGERLRRLVCSDRVDCVRWEAWHSKIHFREPHLTTQFYLMLFVSSFLYQILFDIFWFWQVWVYPQQCSRWTLLWQHRGGSSVGRRSWKSFLINHIELSTQEFSHSIAIVSIYYSLPQELYGPQIVHKTHIVSLSWRCHDNVKVIWLSWQNKSVVA